MTQCSVENAGTFCSIAARAPGSGLRKADGDDLVKLGELESWLWTHANKARQQMSDNVCKLQWYLVTYTDLAASLPNLMQISLVVNPNRQPYKKGNLGKWNSGLANTVQNHHKELLKGL